MTKKLDQTDGQTEERWCGTVFDESHGQPQEQPQNGCDGGILEKPLMNDVTRSFVEAHRDEDVRDLALKAKRKEGLDLPMALDQIAGWQIARKKLPEWASCADIVYPAHISMEQCSSQFTAQYKAEIARRLQQSTPPSAPQSKESSTAEVGMVDLTGGFGVDCSYIAREFSQATYVERQPHLCGLAAHNMAALGLAHVRVVRGDGVEYLRSMEPTWLIYIDPARRDEHGARTYAIEDCTPDVLALRDELLAKARYVMVKLSPMLDWRKAVDDFAGAVAEVHIVSTGNECKELLLVLDGDDGGPRAPHVYCVNDDQRLDYDAAAYTRGLRIGEAPLPERPHYLYEPNASIMKAGCFDVIEERYGVTQVGPGSHLFVSDAPVAGFPGRGFAIEAVGGMGKKELRRLLSGLDRANIAVRNFPLTAPQLRRKLKLVDGGDAYLFGTTMQGGAHVLFRTAKIDVGC